MALGADGWKPQRGRPLEYDLEVPSVDEAKSLGTLRDYLEAPRRRPMLVAIPFLAAIVLALLLGLFLPKRYVASTVVLVELDKVPDSFARDQGRERTHLSTIKSDILTRARIEKLLAELDPYPQLRATSTTAGLVEKLRSDVDLRVRRRNALGFQQTNEDFTFEHGDDAFSMEYVNSDPQKAMLVVNRLAALFIEDASLNRESQAEQTAEFIEAQLADAHRQLEEKERVLGDFKETHMGRLPEQMSSNLATLQRLNAERQSITESLRPARERQLQLEQRLSDPAPALRGGGAPEPTVELAQLRNQLAGLRMRYTDEHPDVRAVLGQIARLEGTLAAGETGTSLRDPSLAAARGQLDRIQRDVKAFEERQAEIDRRVSALQEQVDETPRTEQQLATLTRDYQRLNDNYLSWVKKKQDAQLTARLEKRWSGERFRVLEPAETPKRPAFPKLWLFLLAGTLVGAAVGLASAVAAEALDPTIKGIRQLEATIPFPVLAAFPRVTAKDLMPRRPR